MDEREAEERAAETPLPGQPEPNQEAQPPMADSTRESLGDEPTPAADVEAAEQASAGDDDTLSSQVQGDAADVRPVTAVAAGPSATESEIEEAAVPAAEAEEAAAPSGPTMTVAQEHRAAAAEGLRRGRLPQGDVPVEGADEPAWYVIHCYSGYENKVRHNLEQRIETMGMKDRIFDVVIPTQEEIEVREGKRRTVERHIFPGYVLVNMTLSEESWYVVRNTPGVTGFVGMGNLPTPLRPEEVSQIIKRMESEAPAINVSFKPGERVRIIDGPFNDFRGTVADLDMEHNKVRVMVSFFGRETPVELDFLQVEKA